MITPGGPRVRCRWVAALSFAVALAAAGAPLALSGPNDERHVRVHAVLDGAPVAGARATVLERDGREFADSLDGKGSVLLPVRSPGFILLTLIADGCPAWSRRVSVPQRGAVDVYAILRRAVQVHGMVADRAGRPVAGASIRVFPLDGTDQPRLNGWTQAAVEATPPASITKADGEFSCAVPCAVTSVLVVSADGHVPHSRFLVPDKEADRTPLRVELLESQEIRGLARLGDGVPASFAEIRIAPQPGSMLGAATAEAAPWSRELWARSPMTVTADSSGRFREAGLLPNTGYVAVSASERQALVRTWRGRAGAPAEASAPLLLGTRCRVQLLLPPVAANTVVSGSFLGQPAIPHTSDSRSAEESGVFSGPCSDSFLALGIGLDGRVLLRITSGRARQEGLADLAASSVEIHGAVTDVDGIPIAGARVEGRTRDGQTVSVQTVEGGRFRLLARRGVDMTVSAFLDGPAAGIALPLESDRVAAPATDLSPDLKLVLRPRSVLSGRVRLPSGAPLLGTLAIHSMEGEGIALDLVEVDSEGRFATSRMPNGHRTIALRAAGLISDRLEFDIASGKPVDIGDVRLSPGLTIQGTVTDAIGTPIPDALVTPMQDRTVWGGADASGSFKLTGLARGFPLRILVQAAGWPDSIAAIGADGRIQVRLDVGSRLAGTITASSGQPLGFCHLRLCSKADRERCLVVGTGPDGEFQATVPVGSWLLSLEEDPRWACEPGEVRTLAGDTHDPLNLIVLRR